MNIAPSVSRLALTIIDPPIEVAIEPDRFGDMDISLPGIKSTIRDASKNIPPIAATIQNRILLTFFRILANIFI
jgi:hypothetical protein